MTTGLDEGLGLGNNNRTGLEQINLSYVDLHDLTVITMLQASRETLSVVAFNSCNQLTDLSLAALGYFVPQSLERADFSFCRKVTNRGLVYLCNACVKLKALDLFGCSQIDGIFLNGHANEEVVIEGPLALVKQRGEVWNQQ